MNRVKIALCCTVFLIGSMISLVSAADKNISAKSGQLQQSYVWYDGSEERQVWLDPGVIAELNANKTKQAQSAIKNVSADASPLSSRRSSVRVWKLGKGMDSTAALKALKDAGHGGNYSPVFREGRTSAGRMRALPGNIIVYLDPSWDDSAVAAWAKQNGLSIIKKLEIGPNIFVIKTAPGFDALNTANALYKSGQVVAAFPDWWVEVSTR